MPATIHRQWHRIERRTAPAFALAGLSIVASVLVPLALDAVIDRSWAAGLVLVGLAVLAVSAGLLGLYPRVADRAPRLALVGAAASGLAAVAALGVIGLGGLAAVGDPLWLGNSEPMAVFAALGLAVAGGFALGLLAFGVAGWRTGTPSRTVGGLLLAGGPTLLAPVAIELLGPAAGVETPVWLLFSAIVLVALDALAIGYSLRDAEPAR